MTKQSRIRTSLRQVEKKVARRVVSEMMLKDLVTPVIPDLIRNLPVTQPAMSLPNQPKGPAVRFSLVRLLRRAVRLELFPHVKQKPKIIANMEC